MLDRNTVQYISCLSCSEAEMSYYQLHLGLFECYVYGRKVFIDTEHSLLELSCSRPQKTEMSNGSCLDFHSCTLPAQAPRSQLQELKTLIKRKEAQAKNDPEVFSSARQRAF